MQLRTLYLPILCLVGFAGQAAAIEGASKAIVEDLNAFRDAFAEGTNDTAILATGKEVVASINAATPIVQESPSLDLLQAIKLATSFKSVDESAKTSLDTVVAQRKVADTLNIAADVRGLLVDARAGVAELGAAFGSKVPPVAGDKVKEATSVIDTRFADAVKAYT